MQGPPGRLGLYVDRLRALHPTLPVTTAELVEMGQNNDVLIVNGSLIFRFPRYRQGIDALRREVCLLSVIGRNNALPIPRPIYTSLSSETPEGVCMGYPALRGVPLSQECYATLSSEARQRVADSAAAFLLRLHAQPVDDLVGCGFKMDAPLLHWEQLYGRITKRLFPIMTIAAARWTTELFESFLQSPEQAALPVRLIHGDFGGSNILVDPQRGELTGVIDFSSAHLNDPAIDLAAASTIEGDLLQRLRRTYPLADTAVRRIAFYRDTFGLQEALFGVETGDETALQAGLASIPGQ